MQKHFREIARGARRLGLREARVKHHGGTHPKLTGYLGARRFKWTVSCTPKSAEQHVIEVLRDVAARIAEARHG